MKKRKKLGAVNVMLVAILVLILGVTISKYVLTSDDNSEIPTAKWNVTVTENNIEPVTYTSETLTTGTIAPGTEGTFSITVDATGTETGVNYDISFSDIENKPTNLYFMVGSTRYDSFDDLSAGLSGTINANATYKTSTTTVKWIWNYETGEDDTSKKANNIIDTNEGKIGSTMTFKANVTVEQVTPVVD